MELYFLLSSLFIAYMVIYTLYQMFGPYSTKPSEKSARLVYENINLLYKLTLELLMTLAAISVTIGAFLNPYDSVWALLVLSIGFTIVGFDLIAHTVKKLGVNYNNIVDAFKDLLRFVTFSKPAKWKF
jgi:hypothetical protein